MPELENKIIEVIIAKINLDKYQKEAGNTYVYGVDDVLRLLNNQIK